MKAGPTAAPSAGVVGRMPTVSWTEVVTQDGLPLSPWALGLTFSFCQKSHRDLWFLSL